MEPIFESDDFKNQPNMGKMELSWMDRVPSD